MSLKLLIKEEFLKKDKGEQARIATKAGYKDPSSFSKFLSVPERKMRSFQNLLVTVKEVFNEKYNEVLGKYFLTVDVNSMTARCALEYTQLNKMYDVHAVLIEKMKLAKNADSKEWACVYDVDYKYTFRVVNASDTIDEVTLVNSKKTEMAAYANLLKSYCYYEMKCYSLMEESVKRCRILIPQIKDDFIRQSFMGRLSLLASVSNFNLNNVEACRSYANFGLSEDNYDAVNRWIYLSLGNSYLLENYDLAYKYLKSSLDFSIEKGFMDSEEEAKKSLNFLNILNNKEPIYQIKDQLSKNHQLAFWLFKQGETEKAHKTLTSMDKATMNDMQLAFHNYYLGLVTNTKSYILKSVRLFKKCDSMFYLQLPALELQKLGEDLETIETMIA